MNGSQELKRCPKSNIKCVSVYIIVHEKFLSHSAEETYQIGQKLGSQVPRGTILCFHGDLGAGKTTLIKGVVLGSTGLDSSLVNSPTFVYMNIYKGEKCVYHFDLYRLHDVDEFLSMGFDEFLFSEGICCIEWPEKIEAVLPQSSLHLFLSYQSENCRLIEIVGDQNASL